jgi:hypothetical protein
MSSYDDDKDWLLKLAVLLNRYPHLGAAADLAHMTRAEAWGLFCHVSRLALG